VNPLKLLGAKIVPALVVARCLPRDEVRLYIQSAIQEGQMGPAALGWSQQQVQEHQKTVRVLRAFHDFQKVVLDNFGPLPEEIATAAYREMVQRLLEEGVGGRAP
jgi:hypothetical protein